MELANVHMEPSGVDMDPRNILETSPYHPSVIARIIDENPTPILIRQTFDEMTTPVFQRMCNTIDELARFKDPNEEFKYYEQDFAIEREDYPVAYHRRASLWNIVGKASLFFRLKTPKQYIAYRNATKEYCFEVSSWTDWYPRQRARKNRSETSNWNEDRMGYKPWQMFCMVAQLGALAENAFNANQRRFVENQNNIEIFGEFITDMRKNIQNMAQKVFGHRDPQPAFFYHMRPHEQDEADVLKITASPIQPYAMMKRLLHGLRCVGPDDTRTRQNVMDAYIRRMVERHALFLTGYATYPSSLFNAYVNPKTDVVDEVVRALEEEIEIQICINRVPSENKERCLTIMRGIEALLEEEHKLYGDRPLAFTMGLSKRLGQNSIVHHLDSELVNIIARLHDLSYNHQGDAQAATDARGNLDAFDAFLPE